MLLVCNCVPGLQLLTIDCYALRGYSAFLWLVEHLLNDPVAAELLRGSIRDPCRYSSYDSRSLFYSRALFYSRTLFGYQLAIPAILTSSLIATQLLLTSVIPK